MSSGKTHRRISRAIAGPSAVASLIATDDPLLALGLGLGCYTCPTTPDDDQAEARLSLPWKVIGWILWIGALLLWIYTDDPSQTRAGHYLTALWPYVCPPG